MYFTENLSLQCSMLKQLSTAACKYCTHFFNSLQAFPVFPPCLRISITETVTGCDGSTRPLWSFICGEFILIAVMCVQLNKRHYMGAF
jgi:hypothetical protein